MNAERGTVVEVLLAEYNTLREESRSSIENRMTATNFTFAALAVIIAALLSGEVNRLLTSAALIVLVPQLAKSGLLRWLGEYERSQRAGRHVAQVETRLNEILGVTALTWESHLGTRSIHMGYPYRAVYFLLLGTGYTSSLIGLVVLAQQAESRSSTALLALVVLALLATVAWELFFSRYFARLWRTARSPEVE